MAVVMSRMARHSKKVNTVAPGRRAAVALHCGSTDDLGEANADRREKKRYPQMGVHCQSDTPWFGATTHDSREVSSLTLVLSVRKQCQQQIRLPRRRLSRNGATV